MISFPFAKINLGLHITAKRPDAYHTIETVFYPIRSLNDVLEIVPSTAFRFIPSGITIEGTLDQNLCVQAYKLLQTDFNLPPVDMYLHKVIPMGAGLGGGSSDATFTLINLNRQFDLGLSNSQLADYAQRLGSDCAFFVSGQAAWATGRGEILEPIDINLTGYSLLMVSPGIHVSTAAAYAGVKPATPENDLRSIIQLPISEWKHLLKNDFEQTVFQQYPEIGRIKDALYQQGAVYSAMSGSGSSVFGLFRTETIKHCNPKITGNIYEL